ncbi:LOW QUALITY PROTEIN: apoptosis-enhancing nuclease [Pezoporus flaviventris]|uniref:LOW QUALITY PROTEIN: apoptosis-enhancing nuclease n=1 Tax=Pezoporus flaviventris TaxID=889875 RepID=UPI002AB216B0|nr:LOW QUALITY PROTEIN: apoptosis-enhancing nuclease [Pezoporus flaviventris]
MDDHDGDRATCGLVRGLKRQSAAPTGAPAIVSSPESRDDPDQHPYIHASSPTLSLHPPLPSSLRLSPGTRASQAESCIPSLWRLFQAGMPPGKGQMIPLLPTPKATAPTPRSTHGPAAGGHARPPEGRSKKKSRKHQRFMERRALLEQKGLLSPPKHPGSQTPMAGLEAHSMLTKVDGTTAPHCGKVPKPEQAVSTSLPPSASPDSIARHHSVLLSQGNGSSKKVRTSSPLLRPSKYVAIDCEMVGTGPQGRLSELARCSVVSYEGDVIYDKYVQPELPIVDYRTRWSGITRQHMKRAIPFKAAQAEILKILKDKVVVGHAIHNDFQALKYFHPKDRTRDTSQIPLLNERAGLPGRASVSLKTLARHLLHKKIQVGCKGHSSVEDARTAMELYRLVEVQWETELARSLPPRPPSPITDPTADSNQYMDDQYWPTDLMASSL